MQSYLASQTGRDIRTFEPIAWSSDGFRLPDGVQAGKLAGHAAGLYYIQEPSAMLPAEVRAARPGEKVLDLCAAPGGKSARIAAGLAGSGLLWANEISAERVRALQRNLELTGSTQVVITSVSPEALAQVLPGYFDAVLADVPCSGSGMLRRDDQAAKSYLSYGPESCAPLQRQILESAWILLRPAGVWSIPPVRFPFLKTRRRSPVSWPIIRTRHPGHSKARALTTPAADTRLAALPGSAARAAG